MPSSVASDTESDPKNASGSKDSLENPRHVQIPYADWIAMKKQNEEILAFLSRKSDSDSEMHSDRGRKRRREEEDEDEPSIEDEIDALLGVGDPSQDGDQAGDDDLELDQIEQEYNEEEEVGKPLCEKLAKVIDTMKKAKLSDDKFAEKQKSLKRPANVNVFAPRVNPEVWAMMAHQTKSNDLRLRKSQTYLVSAVYALAPVVEECVNSTTNMKSLVKPVTEAMGLILKAVHDLSMDRRTKILTAPQVNKKYKKLASADIPITKNLFGDDLKGAFATIDSTSKLGSNFTFKGGKFFPKSKNWVNKNQRGGKSWNQGQTRGKGKRPYMNKPQKTETADAE